MSATPAGARLPLQQLADTPEAQSRSSSAPVADSTGSQRRRRQAAEEFERFGACRLRDHTTRELRRLGIRTWRRGPTAPRDVALSPREREVATLVLAGRRNADIARELFLGLKTVESHTRNIYAKLGVTSRVELVTHLAEHAPGAPARPGATVTTDPDAWSST